MKDIKEKPTAHMPRSNATGEIPKAALKKAWTEAKEKSRTMLRESTSTQGDGDYTAAQDTSSVVTDTSYSVIKQNTDFTVQQGRKIARKQAEKYRERHAAEQVETARAHAANERGVSPKQAGHDTLTDAEQRSRRGADLPRQRAKEKAAPARRLWRCARQYGIFLSACTVLSRPLLQGLAWHSVLLLSSALWPLCPARPMASFLPPMPPTPTQLPCNRQ